MSRKTSAQATTDSAAERATALSKLRDASAGSSGGMPGGVSTRTTRAMTRSQDKAAGDASVDTDRPRSATVFKRGKDEGHPQMGDAGRAGAAAAKKTRAALCDISNVREEASALLGKDLMALGTRELDALMARPLSSMEARMQYELSRKAEAGAAEGPASAAEVVMAEAAAAGVQPNWRNIDLNTEKDPLLCGLYIDDIYSYMRSRELGNRPHTEYMESLQRDINHTMRGILVDWLVEVAEEYKLVPETLFLAVNFIDRCLSKYSCVRSSLQLVGVTCMLIAAKFEEIYAPQVEDFCYITDNTYQHGQVLEMEREVLKTLGFNLSTPTVKTFLLRFLKAAESTPGDKLDCLASFLAELTLLEYSFLPYKPSMVAASAVMLALHTLNRPAWTTTLEHYAVYTTQDLKPCVTALHQVFLATSSSSLPAIREKYNSPKHKGVASLPAPASLPEYLFATPAAAQ